MENFSQFNESGKEPIKEPNKLEEKWAGLETAEERLERQFKAREGDSKNQQVELNEPNKPEEKWAGLETAEERVKKLFNKKEVIKEEIKEKIESENIEIEPEKTAEIAEPKEEKAREAEFAVMPEKGRREKAEIAKREKYGIEDPAAKKLVSHVAKGALNSIGSVFGVRLAWEAPKLIYDHFKKKEKREKLSEITYGLLREAQAGEKTKKGEKIKKEKIEAVEIGKGPVAQKIKELNERLKDAKMSPEDKKGLRNEYAQILNEYRHQGKNLEEARTEKTGRLLDLYINNSAQKMAVAREAVNTVSIMTMTPWLRLAGYTAFAGAERAVKTADNYEKKHFREKEGFKKDFNELGFMAKNLTVDAAKETFNGLTWNYFNKGKEKKSAFQKGAEFSSSVFMLLRVAGLAEFERQIHTGDLAMTDGAKKIWENIENGNLIGLLKQGGENWVNNGQRLLSYIGLSENPDQAMRALLLKEKPLSQPSGKGLFETIAEEKGEQQEAAGMEIVKKAQAEYHEKLETIKEMATVKKGEGIEHAFIRQIENNSQAFGFEGDPNNAVEAHRFAQSFAHQTAIENKLVNPITGEETRALYDAKNPSVYILKTDGSGGIEKINPHEYKWSPAEETKNLLIKTEEQLSEIQEQGEIEKDIEDLVPEPSSEIPEQGEKASILEEAGVSQEDIKQSITEDAQKEFIEKTPEITPIQEELVINTPQEIEARETFEEELAEYQPAAINTPQDQEASKQKEIDELAEKFRQENIVKELKLKKDLESVNIPGKKVEIEPKTEIAADLIKNSAEKPLEIVFEDLKGTFRYNEKGDVVSFLSQGKGNLLEARKLLNDDWRGKIMDSVKGGGNVNLHWNKVQGSANEIFQYEKILRKMKEMGLDSSPEALFLKKDIERIIKGTEKQYGDVFK